MAPERRIVLVRHGESTGNVDDTVYEREPDHALALTERGWRQAQETGKRLREVFGRGRRARRGSPAAGGPRASGPPARPQPGPAPRFAPPRRAHALGGGPRARG